ncbi:kinase domain protein (macronuclear) [Tetrahymena thermophila SB210]|uniref:Kinase domain protein n=1 Tax=Tetrahymena thermophila (strain SB210) TaxID=312017 RepID=I7M2H6_TETTS|nr:kinase domain protein [Tetrahymena thermophila SB210]EAS00406.1 kinase domain protein [Tetrahymena thermophila SB210]|eukprot:XP_001020651.1 kinase domain protein [Tetrahymena thermophila SB210]
MEELQVNFNNELIESNNYDIHKICVQIIQEIFKQVDNNRSSENKQKISQQFQNVISQIEVLLQDLNNKISLEVEEKIFQIIYLFCINIFKFHDTVQKFQYSYSVIPVLQIGYEGMKNPDKIKIDSLLQEIFQFYQTQQHLNTYDKKAQHGAKLIAAYFNIQQQKYNPSLKILETLESHYEIEGEEVIKKRQKLDSCCVSDQQWDNQKNQIFRQGFYESIITFKALNYVFQNKINELTLEIEKLENILSDVYDERMSQRLIRHIKLFKTHQFFMQKQFDQAKATLGDLKFGEIEEALLLFFNNQNIQCIRNLETIYYNLFSDQFFKIFTLLQEIERKQISQYDIQEINKIYQETQKQGLNYEYGKGLILLFMVICSRLLRIGKKYKESQDMMVKMFQTCQATKTQFQDSLLIFFKYDHLLSYLYEKVENKKKDMFTDVKKINGTKMSEIYSAKKDGVDFILKTINLESESSKMSKFDILNEIAIQMLVSHRNILKVYDLYQNEKGKIVLVQKRLGENLREYLKKKIDGSYICQNKRYGYILQIINVFQYLHNLNIIHCDLKLDNILVQPNDDSKIKLIDFGFSQIKLFNKYFKPIGTTFYLAPSELKKNNQLCTFESEIYMIAKTMIEILELNETNLENPKFLISQQLKQLIRNMTEKKIEERCVMSDVLQIFKLDFFILKIYFGMKQGETNQEEYECFSQYMLKLFKEFISDKYMICLSNQNKAETSNIKNQNCKDEKEQRDIWDSIIRLMQSNDEDFITCLQDNDIKLFCQSFVPKDSDLKEIDFDEQIQQITKNQKQEDANSKNDILNEYQKDIIDRTNFTSNHTNEGQDIKGELQNIQQDVYKQMNQIIQGLQKNFQGQTQTENSQLYCQSSLNESKLLSEYQVKVLDIGNLSGQVSIQQLSQLSNGVNSHYNQSNASFNRQLENSNFYGNQYQQYQLSQISQSNQMLLNNNINRDNNMQSYILVQYSHQSSDIGTGQSSIQLQEQNLEQQQESEYN